MVVIADKEMPRPAAASDVVKVGFGTIQTISGRYYDDRDNHWDRTKLAYEAVASGEVKRRLRRGRP